MGGFEGRFSGVDVTSILLWSVYTLSRNKELYLVKTCNVTRNNQSEYFLRNYDMLKFDEDIDDTSG